MIILEKQNRLLRSGIIRKFILPSGDLVVLFSSDYTTMIDSATSTFQSNIASINPSRTISHDFFSRFRDYIYEHHRETPHPSSTSPARTLELLDITYPLVGKISFHRSKKRNSRRSLRLSSGIVIKLFVSQLKSLSRIYLEEELSRFSMAQWVMYLNCWMVVM